MTITKRFFYLSLIIGVILAAGGLTMSAAYADGPPTFTNSKGPQIFLGTLGKVLGQADVITVMNRHPDADYAVLHFVFEDDTPNAADYQDSQSFADDFLETCSHRMSRYATLLSIGYGGNRTLPGSPRDPNPWRGSRGDYDIAGTTSPLLSRYLGPGPDCLATGAVGALLFDENDQLLNVWNPVFHADGRRAFAQDEHGAFSFPHTKRVKVTDAPERCTWGTDGDGERVWFCYPVEGGVPVYEEQVDWTVPALHYPDTHKTAAAIVRFP